MKKLNLDDIKTNLLNPLLSENAHVLNIKKISLNFTSRRDGIKKYVMNEDLVSSYALYYLPTNVPKFEFIFQMLPENIKDKLLSNTFIDVGCGPGTYSYAVSILGHNKKNICVDSSGLMLDQAKKILEANFLNKEFEFVKKLNSKIENATLFFGNSINEMGIQNAIDLVNVVNPDVVMFIEPGTSELFLELKKFREWMSGEFDVAYPCPSSLSCPSNWCHQVLRTTHDFEVERLSQLVSLDRKIMPMTSHVYIRKSNLAFSDFVTVIQFLNETKFSFIYEVCGLVDGNNQNFKIEILKKNLSKSMEKRFKNENVGIRLEIIKEKLVSDIWRVSLK